MFHLLDPLELDFTFRRPMRFLDMEGGSAIFAEPSEIADRYHTVLRKYLASVKEIVANRPSTITACASTRITSRLSCGSSSAEPAAAGGGDELTDVRTKGKNRCE